MEKSTIKSKSLFSKFLPRVVTFKGPPFSPAPCRGFSGQISIIPAEARRRSKCDEIESQEPTSPKVSCIGQIKQRKKKNSNNNKKKKLMMMNKSMKQENMAPHWSSGHTPARKSESSADNLRDEIPSISKMKRFASSRDVLSGFDWTAYLAVEEEEEEECRVGCSDPIGRETAAQRKEVNLWRRRSVSPLPQLKVHASSSSTTR